MSLNRSVRAVVTLLVALSVTSCGTMRHYTEVLSHIGRKKKIDEKKDVPELLIGVIEMVNPEQRFVLIRTEVNMPIHTGTLLEARAANGGKTKLIVTPEKKLHLVSADITEGFPQAGEMVVLVAAEQPAKENTTTQSPNQSNTQTLLDPIKPVPQPATPSSPNEPVPGVPPVIR